MPEIKKNIKQRNSKKRTANKAVIVTKTKVAAKSVLLSKKLKQVNELLGKSKLLDS